MALEHAKRLWTYLAALRNREPADAVVVCCSYDLRVCDYACDLIKQQLAPRLILSGKTGNWTRFLWTDPEAHVFRACCDEVGRARVDSCPSVTENGLRFSA